MTFARIAIIVFVLVSLVHLVFIFLKKEKMRRVSKVLIMPLLAAVYVSLAQNVFLPLLLALGFGWIGDALLLNIKNKTFFKMGLAAFLLGHIVYTAVFIVYSGGVNIPVLLIYIPAAVVLGVTAFRFVRPDRDMKIPVIVYIVVIEIMCLWGLELLFSRRDISGLLIFAGCLCFMISDCMLGYYSFRTLSLPGAVLIMVFYILAQTGIVFGFLPF